MTLPGAKNLIGMALLLLVLVASWQSVRAQDGGAYEPDLRPPTAGADAPALPPAAAGSDLWRDIRGGAAGRVLMLDRKTAVLIQAEGESWRRIVTDTLAAFGAWLLLLTIVTVAALYAVLGRIEIRGRGKGRKIQRFDALQRFSHWLAMITFVVLAATGLSQLYGRALLAPLLGGDGYARLAMAAKYLHAMAGPAFAVAVLLLAVTWFPRGRIAKDVRRAYRDAGALDRLVGKHNWLQRASWAVFVFGGLAMVATGAALLFPFAYGGVDYAGTAGMQRIHLVHAVLGLLLIAAVILHVYLDVVARQGGFGAILSGYVSETWARRHHEGWLATVRLGDSGTRQARNKGRASAKAGGGSRGGAARSQGSSAKTGSGPKAGAGRRRRRMQRADGDAG